LNQDERPFSFGLQVLGVGAPGFEGLQRVEASDEQLLIVV
jgi:hypothetical protein